MASEQFFEWRGDPIRIRLKRLIMTPAFHERVIDQAWKIIYLPEETVQKRLDAIEQVIRATPNNMLELRALLHSTAAKWASSRLVGGPLNPELTHHLEAAATLYERLGWTGCEVRIRRNIQNFIWLFPGTPSQL